MNRKQYLLDIKVESRNTRSVMLHTMNCMAARKNTSRKHFIAGEYTREEYIAIALSCNREIAYAAQRMSSANRTLVQVNAIIGR